MRNKAYDVSKYAFDSADRILPDANIWLYLYAPASIAYPAPLKAAIASYSKAWATLYTQGATVWLDTLVLSEVVNRLLDNEWQRVDPPDPKTRTRRYSKRKDFRQSTDYPTAARSVEALAKMIVADSKALDHPFSQWNLNDLLAEFGAGSTDWNDQLLVQICLHHGTKLLTHDADHVHGGIDVITANPRLIAACP